MVLKTTAEQEAIKGAHKTSFFEKLSKKCTQNWPFWKVKQKCANEVFFLVCTIRLTPSLCYMQRAILARSHVATSGFLKSTNNAHLDTYVFVCMCMCVNILPLSKYLPVLFCNWSRFWNRVREKPEIENILQNTNIRWVQPMIKTESCLWNTYPEFSWQFVCSATVTFFRFNSSIACHSFSCLPWHPEAILNLLFLLFFSPCRVSINCW